MKLYIYNVETMEVAAIAEGSDNQECEDKAFNYLGSDEYAGTYSPAFGAIDGLIENPAAEEL